MRLIHMAFRVSRKKLFQFLFAFLLITQTLSAQNENPFWEKVELGIKAGTNVGTLITDANSRMNVRATYQIGLLAEYTISEKFSFIPELIYSRQGENSRGTLDGSRFRNVLMLDYVAMPLMINYNLIDGLWAETGVQPAVLIRAEYDQVLGSQGNVQSVNSNFKPFDMLYNIGLRYKTEWGFFVGFRYSIGLNNSLENSFLGANTMRHSVYQFNFGYFF